MLYTVFQKLEQAQIFEGLYLISAKALHIFPKHFKILIQTSNYESLILIPVQVNEVVGLKKNIFILKKKCQTVS